MEYVTVTGVVSGADNMLVPASREELMGDQNGRASSTNIHGMVTLAATSIEVSG